MRKADALRRGGSLPLFLYRLKRGLPLLIFIGMFYFTVTSLQGQVVFLGSMFQEKEVKPGEKVFIEFALLNPKERNIEVDLFVKDYSIEDEQLRFLEPGSVARSNAEWVKIEHPRMLLGAGKRASLRIPVNVPDSSELRGSFYSCLIVKTMPPVQVVHAEKRVKVGLQYGIQVVTTIPGGEKKVEFSQVQVMGETKDELSVQVVNPGDVFLELELKSELEGIDAKRFRVYPGCKRKLKLDLKGLEDGEYKTRLFLDDGDMLLIPFKVDFHKGIVEELSPLVPIGEKVGTKKRGRNYLRLWVVMSAGSFRKGLSLSGSTSIDSFRLGSGYRRFYMVGRDDIYESYFSSLGLRVWKLDLSVYAYRFESQTLLNSGLRLNLKKTQVNIAFIGSQNSKVINLHFTHQLPWKHRLQGFFYWMKERRGWSISYSVPLTLWF